MMMQQFTDEMKDAKTTAIQQSTDEKKDNSTATMQQSTNERMDDTATAMHISRQGNARTTRASVGMTMTTLMIQQPLWAEKRKKKQQRKKGLGEKINRQSQKSQNQNATINRGIVKYLLGINLCKSNNAL